MRYYTCDENGTWLHFGGFCVKVGMQTNPTPYRFTDKEAERHGLLGKNLAFGEYLYLGVN